MTQFEYGEEMKYLTVLDYVIFVLFMVGGIWGAIKGFLEEISTKFGYIFGFVMALMFSHRFSAFFQTKAGFPAWVAAFISYFLIFVIGYLVIKGVGKILSTIIDSANLTVVDNILGFVLGLAEAFLLIAAFEYILGFQNLFNLQQYFDESLFSSKLLLPFARIFSSTISSFVSGA